MLTVKITDYIAEAKDVVVLELRDPHKKPLPPFEPGAHLEVKLSNGLIRHYSLLNDSRETERYVIGVARVAAGRGGSEFVHRMFAVGTQLSVSAPRNNFPLDRDASAYRFVAGGIGITPIMAMIRWCIANNRLWRLVYAARNRARAALYEELSQLGGEHVYWHFDDERDAHLDVAHALDGMVSGEQVYCCGPEPLMKAVQEKLANRPGIGHFEWFSAPKDESKASTVETTDKGFTVKLQRSGVSLDVPAGKSVLEVLEENGISVPFACREGACRTCETTVCGGEPDHRDYVLSDEERAQNKTMMLCVSRAQSPTLCLDL